MSSLIRVEEHYRTVIELKGKFIGTQKIKISPLRRYEAPELGSDTVEISISRKIASLTSPGLAGTEVSVLTQAKLLAHTGWSSYAAPRHSSLPSMFYHVADSSVGFKISFEVPVLGKIVVNGIYLSDSVVALEIFGEKQISTIGPAQAVGLIGQGYEIHTGKVTVSAPVEELGQITKENVRILLPNDIASNIADPVIDAAIEIISASRPAMDLLGDEVLDIAKRIDTEVLRGKDLQNFLAAPECFLAGISVSLPCKQLKPIEEVVPNDLILSYDHNGELVTSRVERVFRNRVKHVLDVHGLHVTPGHVTLCGDGQFAGQHVPMIDILRSDGALVRQDGSLVRAGTNAPVGSALDQLIHAVAGMRRDDGGLRVHAHGLIRLGTKYITEDGYEICVADLIAAAGGSVTLDGLIERLGAPGTPFLWPFGPSLPKPEDYVLQRSALTLAAIYDAGEWEQRGPRLAAPPAPAATNPGIVLN